MSTGYPQPRWISSWPQLPNEGDHENRIINFRIAIMGYIDSWGRGQ